MVLWGAPWGSHRTARSSGGLSCGTGVIENPLPRFDAVGNPNLVVLGAIELLATAGRAPLSLLRKGRPPGSRVDRFPDPARGTTVSDDRSSRWRRNARAGL
jgi:hypothetical protein